MDLSDHFTLEECIKSNIALRHNIDNTPHDGEVIVNLRALCRNIAEPVRKHVGKGFVPSSAYRSPALNLFIGSKPSSQHLKGQAMDFEVPGFDNYKLGCWIRDNMVYDQLILEFYKDGEPTSGWIHCSYVDDPDKEGLNRQMSLIFDGRNFRKF